MKKCIFRQKRRALRLFIKTFTGDRFFNCWSDLRIQPSQEVLPVHENALSELGIELGPQAANNLQLAVQSGAGLVVHTLRQDRIHRISHTNNPSNLRNVISFNRKRIGATATSVVLMMHPSSSQDSFISHAEQPRHLHTRNSVRLHFCELLVSQTSRLLQNLVPNGQLADIVESRCYKVLIALFKAKALVVADAASENPDPKAVSRSVVIFRNDCVNDTTGFQRQNVVGVQQGGVLQGFSVLVFDSHSFMTPLIKIVSAYTEIDNLLVVR